MMSGIGAISQFQNASRVGGAQRSGGSAPPPLGRVDTTTISQEARNAANRANTGTVAPSQGALASATAGAAEYRRLGRGQTGQGQTSGGAGNCPHSGGGMSMSM